MAWRRWRPSKGNHSCVVSRKDSLKGGTQRHRNHRFGPRLASKSGALFVARFRFGFCSGIWTWKTNLKLHWTDVALGSRPKSASLARTAAWSPPLRRAQSFVLEWGSTAGGPLTRIIHKFSTAAAQSSVLAVFRSVGLLDVLHEYDCGGLGRKPCHDGAFTASLRKLMNNPG